MDNQQGPTVQYTKLCLMLCGNLHGRGIWGRMNACVCITKSLCCSPETITTLLIGYTPVQNKRFKNRNIVETRKKKIKAINISKEFDGSLMLETEFDPWVRKIPWRRKRQPTPVILPGKSHGRRSMVGYSP